MTEVDNPSAVQELRRGKDFFDQSLLTEVNLYHSRPRVLSDKRERDKCLLEEKAGPGLKIRVEGANSWQQWCKKHPKGSPADIWVEGKIVFDPKHHLEGRAVFVTRGDMKRLPPENRKASRKHLNKNAAKGTGSYAQQEPTTIVQSQPQTEAIFPVLPTEEVRVKEVTSSAEEIPLTQIILHPGVRLFDYAKPRIEGQTDEQREGTLNNLKPEVVTKATAMTVPGINPPDAYRHLEGTFFKGTIGGKECWAWIKDVRRFAEIAREKKQQVVKNPS